MNVIGTSYYMYIGLGLIITIEVHILSSIIVCKTQKEDYFYQLSHVEDLSNLEIYNQHIKKNDSMNDHGGTLLIKVIFGVKMLTNVTPESIYDKTADSP